MCDRWLMFTMGNRHILGSANFYTVCHKYGYTVNYTGGGGGVITSWYIPDLFIARSQHLLKAVLVPSMTRRPSWKLPTWWTSSPAQVALGGLKTSTLENLEAKHKELFQCLHWSTNKLKNWFWMTATLSKSKIYSRTSLTRTIKQSVSKLFELMDTIAMLQYS